MRQTLLAILLASSAASAAAQEPTPERRFEFGTFDLYTSLGFTSLLYPSINLSFDLGVLPIGDAVVIAIGARAEAGYCLLCSALSALGNTDVEAYYGQLNGTLLVHMPPLREALDIESLDAYFGGAIGPVFYGVNVGLDDDPATAEYAPTTLLVGPVLGARVGAAAGGRIFGYGELGYFFEFGVDDFSFVDSTGRRIVVQTYLITRGGISLLLGGGIRF